MNIPIDPLVKLVGGSNETEGNLYVWDTTSQSYRGVCDYEWTKYSFFLKSYKL